MLAKRNGLAAAQIARLSTSAQESIIRSERFLEAGTVGTYIAFGSEVRTDMIISEAKKLDKIVALPRVERDSISFYELSDRKHLVKGHYGIMEPLPEGRVKKIDVLVVPGIAFDGRGYRLGYGKGYFDKFLSKNPTLSIGLAYSLQIIANIPHGAHDRRMDAIATEKGIIMSGE